MKTLYIVRHGKSSWDYPNLTDHQRPLIDRGVNKTNKIVAGLIAHNANVDLIVSSDAKRAHETAKIIATGICYPIDKILLDPVIYHADCDALISILEHTSNDIEKLMIVGHNPTLTQIANTFVREKFDYLPTSGTVCISFETSDWNQLKLAKSNLDYYIFPKINHLDS